jgi:hypothetical protein
VIEPRSISVEQRIGIELLTLACAHAEVITALDERPELLLALGPRNATSLLLHLYRRFHAKPTATPNGLLTCKALRRAEVHMLRDAIQRAGQHRSTSVYEIREKFLCLANALLEVRGFPPSPGHRPTKMPGEMT